MRLSKDTCRKKAVRRTSSATSPRKPWSRASRTNRRSVHCAGRSNGVTSNSNGLPDCSIQPSSTPFNTTTTLLLAPAKVSQTRLHCRCAGITESPTIANAADESRQSRFAPVDKALSPATAVAGDRARIRAVRIPTARVDGCDADTCANTRWPDCDYGNAHSRNVILIEAAG